MTKKACNQKGKKQIVDVETILELGAKIVLFDGKVRTLDQGNLVLEETRYCGVELSEPLLNRTELQKNYYQIKRVYDITGTLIAERLNQYTDLLSTQKGTLKADTGCLQGTNKKTKLNVSKELKNKFQSDDRKLQRKNTLNVQKLTSVTYSELTNEAQKEIETRLKRVGAESVQFRILDHGVVVTTKPKESLLYLFK